MVVPRPHKITASRELVPGCVLEVTVALGGTERRVAFVSIYLPPDSRRQVLTQLEALPRPGVQDVFAGGDVNLPAHAPREDD